MERGAKFTVTIALIATAAVLIVIYAYLQSREFLRGPQVVITSPADGSVFTESLVTVEGVASNVSIISLNDAPIFIDQSGHFREKLLLQSGYNILTVSAQDRFGKKVRKKLELIYKEPEKKLATSSAPIYP